jgi:hypothetical protein
MFRPLKENYEAEFLVRTSENVGKLGMAFMKSPRRSVRRHSAATGLSDRSVRIIFHKNLSYHPYKTAIIQEFGDRDMTNSGISSEQLLDILNDDYVISTVLMTD